MGTRSLQHEIADLAADWLGALPERPVLPAHTPAEVQVTEARSGTACCRSMR